MANQAHHGSKERKRGGSFLTESRTGGVRTVDGLNKAKNARSGSNEKKRKKNRKLAGLKISTSGKEI